MSNAKIRELLRQGAQAIPEAAAKLGVKVVTINVLGPEHRLVAIVEADDIDAVRNFVIESRMIQWNTTNVHPSWTVEETLAKVDTLPTMF
jgi:uncharacterized protein with GYD domain